jgi:hypothetical protein
VLKDNIKVSWSRDAVAVPKGDIQPFKRGDIYEVFE